jgi:hypothetical protein
LLPCLCACALQAALAKVQADCGLRHELAAALLSMLDYLGVSRREAHQHIVARGTRLLLDWLAGVRAQAAAAAAARRQRAALGQGGGGGAGGAGGVDDEEGEGAEEGAVQRKLERLLKASFKYMGVELLKQVGCVPVCMCVCRLCLLAVPAPVRACGGRNQQHPHTPPDTPVHRPAHTMFVHAARSPWV